MYYKIKISQRRDDGPSLDNGMTGKGFQWNGSLTK